MIKFRAILTKYHKFCWFLSVHMQGMFRSECQLLTFLGLHKEHNAEDVRLKTSPAGRCPKAKLRVIAFLPYNEYVFKAMP